MKKGKAMPEGEGLQTYRSNIWSIWIYVNLEHVEDVDPRSTVFA